MFSYWIPGIFPLAGTALYHCCIFAHVPLGREGRSNNGTVCRGIISHLRTDKRSDPSSHLSASPYGVRGRPVSVPLRPPRDRRRFEVQALLMLVLVLPSTETCRWMPMPRNEPVMTLLRQRWRMVKCKRRWSTGCKYSKTPTSRA